MNVYVDNLGSNSVTQYNIIMPLDAVYRDIDVRSREQADIALSGTTSPYSVAMMFLEIRLRTGDRDDPYLSTALNWIENPTHQNIVHRYIRRLIDEMELYIPFMLAQLNLTIADTKLLACQEQVIDKWRDGHVTLTITPTQQNGPSYVVGTPYPTHHTNYHTTVPTTSGGEIPPRSVYPNY